MPDREKVIKALKCCIEWDSCKDCPYETPNEYDIAECTLSLHKDALALLKEQEEEIENLKQTAQSMMEGVCLLKEQEAVKPEMEHSGSGVTWWNVCGNCKTAINPNDKFCHECGRPVLWGDR